MWMSGFQFFRFSVFRGGSGAVKTCRTDPAHSGGPGPGAAGAACGGGQTRRLGTRVAPSRPAPRPARTRPLGRPAPPPATAGKRVRLTQDTTYAKGVLRIDSNVMLFQIPESDDYRILLAADQPGKQL